MKESLDIKSLIEEIDKFSNMIKESYVFDGEEPMIQGEEPMPQEGGEVPMEGEVNAVDVADENINQIRELALSGIQEYSNDVESEEYNIFKRIWMECDKYYSNKNKELEGKK